MKMNNSLKPVIKNTIILAIIILAISCTGRKEPITQNETAALQTAAVVEGQFIETTVFPETRLRDFSGGWQYEMEKDVYEAAIHNYFSSYYPNQIIDGIQHIELKLIEQGFVDAISFLVSYLDKDSSYDTDTFYTAKIRFVFVNDALEVWSGIYDEFEGGAYDVVKNHVAEYDFIKDIPGRQLGNSAVLIGDYNNDGYDDIIIIKPAMIGFAFQMFSYDFWESSKFLFIAPITDQIEFLPSSWESRNEPAIQFVTYQEMEGFILCEPARTREHVVVWVFYTWDDETKKYVNKGVVDYKAVQPQWIEPDFSFTNGEQYNILDDDLRKWFSTRIKGDIERGATIMGDVQYVDFKIPGRASFVGTYDNPKRGTVNWVFILDARYQEVRFEIARGRFDIRNDSRFDFIKSLPGRQLGNSSVLIGDYSNDGEEKIMVFYRNGNGLSIWGYDKETKQIKRCCGIDFWVREPEYGPPVRFVKYRGTDGFVRRWMAGVIKDENDEVSERIEGWVFYSWNKDEKYFDSIQLENINEVEPLWF